MIDWRVRYRTERVIEEARVIVSDLPQVSQVVEIKPDCKYIIQMPAWVDQEQFRSMVDVLNEWWDSPHPIFLLAGGVTLVKVTKVNEQKPLVSQSLVV